MHDFMGRFTVHYGAKMVSDVYLHNERGESLFYNPSVLNGGCGLAEKFFCAHYCLNFKKLYTKKTCDRIESKRTTRRSIFRTGQNLKKFAVSRTPVIFVNWFSNKWENQLRLIPIILQY